MVALDSSVVRRFALRARVHPGAPSSWVDSNTLLGIEMVEAAFTALFACANPRPTGGLTERSGFERSISYLTNLSHHKLPMKIAKYEVDDTKIDTTNKLMVICAWIGARVPVIGL